MFSFIDRAVKIYTLKLHNEYEKHLIFASVGIDIALPGCLTVTLLHWPMINFDMD